MYNKEVDAMRWSFSRLSSFENCPYEFYLNYIVADDDAYPAESNYYADVGRYVHEILAKIFLGELSPDDAPDYFMDHFDENVYYEASQNSMKSTFDSCLEYFATVDFDWLDNFEVLGVEKEITFRYHDHEFIGYIDLLLKDKRDGSIIVVDHKSSEYPLRKDGKVKKQCAETFEKYKRQMYLYAHGVKQLVGVFPTLFCWNHFKDGGKVAQHKFVEQEYADTMTWVDKQIEAASNEDTFEPNESYFYCFNLCKFRNSCDYKMMPEDDESE